MYFKPLSLALNGSMISVQCFGK